MPLKSDGKDVRGEFTLSQGDTAVFALERVTDETPPRGCPHAEAEREFTATVAFWRRWLQQSRYCGRWREMVHRSTLALKLLTYTPNGAIVAAPTTSCPTRRATGARRPRGSATARPPSCNSISTAP